MKPLCVQIDGNSLRGSLPDNIVHTAVPKPKIEFIREILEAHEKSVEVVTVDDDYWRLVIKKTESATKGQSDKSFWFVEKVL